MGFPHPSYKSLLRGNLATLLAKEYHGNLMGGEGQTRRGSVSLGEAGKEQEQELPPGPSRRPIRLLPPTPLLPFPAALYGSKKRIMERPEGAFPVFFHNITDLRPPQAIREALALDA